ncbi:TerC family protein, partial [Ectopseudomonas oleovorans]|uniref:TerC family protein n=1 Tax=Ectopseudomonas oleovorans TaxID=301 RepID=UPI003B97563D
MAMEVVLGIDNLIFISILTNKLPEHQRERARRIGIGLVLIPMSSTLEIIHKYHIISAQISAWEKPF